MSTLYETDFYAWSLDQAARLRGMLAERLNSPIDLENVAEEIEGLGKSHRAQLVNRLAQLDEHLLKLAFSLSYDPRRQWRLSVVGQRKRIARLLAKNPSLRRELAEALDEAHDEALAAFDDEKLIELNMPELPGVCPFPVEDMLRDDWWPDARGVA